MKLNKIFVSKQAGIGDVVLLTPILAELKRKYPNSKITIMTLPNAFDVVVGLPFVDEVFSYDKKKDSIWKVIKKMWGHDIALLFDLQYRPAFAAFLAGIPVRIGLAHKRKLWLTHSLPWERYMDHTYEPYVFAEILQRTLGIELAREKLTKVYVSPIPAQEEQASVNALAQYGFSISSPYIACSPQTALYLKDWPAEKWQQLFSRLYDQYKIPVVVFGNGGKAKRLWDMPGVINLCEKTSLREAMFIIKNAKLLVNSCSLPIHIAAAYEVPSVILYGYTDPKRWAPREKCTIVSANLSCSPCDGYNKVECKDSKCMQAITVEEVFVACQDLIQ